MLSDAIENQVDFVVETVLSSGKYRDNLELAKRLGFKTGMVYISLHPAELSPARVEARVLKGGHHVERERAIARYHRSHAEFAWFAPRTDKLIVFDNSAPGGNPILIASKSEGAPLQHHYPGLNPAIDHALNEAFPSRGI